MHQGYNIGLVCTRKFISINKLLLTTSVAATGMRAEKDNSTPVPGEWPLSCGASGRDFLILVQPL